MFRGYENADAGCFGLIWREPGGISQRGNHARWFEIVVFATPIALVMRIREAAQLSKQGLSEAPPEPATSILCRRRRASSL